MIETFNSMGVFELLGVTTVNGNYCTVGVI